MGRLGAPRGRRVHSGSRGFIQACLVVVGVRVGSLGRAYGSSGTYGFVWVRTARLGVVGLIRVGVGSLGRPKGSSSSFWVVWVLLGAFWCRRVHTGSRGFTRASLGVDGLIRVWFTQAHLGVVGFSRCSCGFTLAPLVIVGLWVHLVANCFFCRVQAWVHSGAPSGRQVHSGSRGFTLARLGVVVLNRVRLGSLGRS